MSRFGFSNKGKDTWLIYTLDGCPYCTMAEDLLQKNGQQFTSKEGKHHLSEMKRDLKRTGHADHSTYPKIFRNNEFFGGYGELKNLFE